MQQDLPRWPIILLGWLFPIMWLLGAGFLFVAATGAICAWVLFSRRHVILPPGWFLWFAFLSLAVASVVQVDTSGRLVGYVMRLLTLLGATAIGLYVYSATPRSLSDRTVLTALMGLWVFVIVGGWLGVLFPEVVLSTPLSRVIPGALSSNSYVDSLVRPRFAEIQNPWGAEEPFLRPAAPFPGSNGWGCNVALLLPLVVAMIAELRGLRRWLLVSVTVAAVIPAVHTLNRGLVLGVTVALIYFAVHRLMRGHVVPALVTLLAGLSGLIVAQATGVIAAFSERLAVSNSNDTRGAIYSEAFDRAVQSPWIGYGAPRPSLTREVSVGTQGQVWYLMVSHGLLALVFFILFFLVAAWVGRNATGLALAAHIVVVVGLVLIWVYGLDGPQLAVFLLSAALSMRNVRTRPFPRLWVTGSSSRMSASRT